MTANCYHGTKARHYEKARKQQLKWKFERAIMLKVLKRLGDEVENIIDAPVGTGIFLSFYNVPVRGYDISQDMLDIAEEKQTGAKLSHYDFVKKPIYAKADLVVCIRFLNLVNWNDATRALKHLLAASKKYILFSMRTVPNSYTGKLNVGRVFLHNDPDLTRLLADNGFAIVERFRHHDAVPGNYDLILCKRVDPE